MCELKLISLKQNFAARLFLLVFDDVQNVCVPGRVYMICSFLADQLEFIRTNVKKKYSIDKVSGIVEVKFIVCLEVRN